MRLDWITLSPPSCLPAWGLSTAPEPVVGMLERTLNHLTPGDHVLLPDSPGLARAFILAALANGSRALLFVPRNELSAYIRTAEELAASLPEGREAVVILPCEPIVDRIVADDRRALADQLRHHLRSAQGDGWAGLWMLSHASPSMAAAGNDPGAVHGEAILHELRVGIPLVALCPYRQTPPPGTLEALRATHTHDLFAPVRSPQDPQA